jgi:hypothetical protein
MPVDVLVETTISRPPADVAAFAVDPSNAPLARLKSILESAGSRPPKEADPLDPGGLQSASLPAGQPAECFAMG